MSSISKRIEAGRLAPRRLAPGLTDFVDPCVIKHRRRGLPDPQTTSPESLEEGLRGIGRYLAVSRGVRFASCRSMSASIPI